MIGPVAEVTTIVVAPIILAGHALVGLVLAGLGGAVLMVIVDWRLAAVGLGPALGDGTLRLGSGLPVLLNLAIVLAVILILMFLGDNRHSQDQQCRKRDVRGAHAVLPDACV